MLNSDPDDINKLNRSSSKCYLFFILPHCYPGIVVTLHVEGRLISAKRKTVLFKLSSFFLCNYIWISARVGVSADMTCSLLIFLHRPLGAPPSAESGCCALIFHFLSIPSLAFPLFCPIFSSFTFTFECLVSFFVLFPSPVSIHLAYFPHRASIFYLALCTILEKIYF